MTGLRTALSAAATAVALLAVGCAGPGGGSAAPGGAPPGGVGKPWAWELPECVGYRPVDYRSPEQREAVEVRSGPDMIAYVEQYRPGWGERAVAEIRAVLRACASYEHGGSGDPAAFREQHLLVETGFAGDESLLVEIVRLRPPELRTRYAAVVRNGDRVVTLRSRVAAPTTAACLADSPAATCPALRATAPAGRA